MRLTNNLKNAIVRAIMQDVPKPKKENRHRTVQATLVKAMSPACRKVYLANPSIFKTTWTGDTTYDGLIYSTRDVVMGDAPKDVLQKLLKPYEQEDEAYRKAQQNLSIAVEGCTTLKQLKEAFPEFEKYLPTEQQPTKNLPALANVVSDLVKLGWAKNATKGESK